MPHSYLWYDSMAFERHSTLQKTTQVHFKHGITPRIACKFYRDVKSQLASWNATIKPIRGHHKYSAHWGNSYTPRCTQLIICYKVVLTGIEPASQSSNLILRRILCHWATETQINLQWKHVMSFSFPTKRYHKSYYPHPESNQCSQIRSPVCTVVF